MVMTPPSGSSEPGGGSHGGRYINISTNDGKFKIVGSDFIPGQLINIIIFLN
jgi:hypothetical protein